MNNNFSTKKRKRSFANDRLKNLRNSITAVVNKSSSDIQTPVSSPSVKSSTHNTKGYSERKKLKAVRKLKDNDFRKHTEYSVKVTAEDVNEDLPDIFYPKRRKFDVEFTGSSGKSSSSVNSRQNLTALHHPPSCSINVKGTLKSPKLKSNSIIEHKKNIVISNSSDIITKQNRVNSRECNNTSLSTRLEAIKNGTKFSESISPKQKSKIQHKTSNSIQLNGSFNSINHREYFGKALNAVYEKLFGSQVDPNVEVERGEMADAMDWEPVHGLRSCDPENCKKSFNREMYIIVDTNIFLDSLNILKGIVDYETKEGIRPVIYVPWMVFNELDFIKDKGTRMKSEAVRAIDFINKMLLKKDGKLLGQNVHEAYKQMYVGKSPDDKITSCCLQVKEKGLKTILLSNDQNLRNKLIINGIPSFSCKEFMKSLDDASPDEEKINSLLEDMSKCCTHIIVHCCEEAYGTLWNKLALLENQPWDFKMCLEIFKRYWSSVFQYKLLKQFLQAVEKMILILRNSGSLKDSGSFESFVEDCLSLCFFFLDLEIHRDLIEETVKKIQNFK